MNLFYLILICLSGGYLTLQLTVWLVFGKPLFPDSGELFERTKNRVEWQTIFPKNLLRLIIFVFVSSIIGALLELAGVVSWLGLPCAAIGGLAFNFLLSTVISPLYNRIIKQGMPNESELENMDGEVTQEISPDMYGEIRIRCGKTAYYFRAVSANGRTLPVGTPVIVIYSEDAACFVESKEHFFDVLFEETSEELTEKIKPEQHDNNEIRRA